MTDDDEKVLNHVVPDGKAWDAHQRAHNIAKHGLEEGTRIADANLAAKVKRWKPSYETESAKPGYKTRAVRDTEEKAVRDAEIAEAVEKQRQAEAQRVADFNAAVEAKVKEILDKKA